MTPPPSTPKRPRRTPPKIVGHTAPTPRVMGTTARSSLRSLAPTPTNHRPTVRTTASPPPGAPGMRSFPRARITTGDLRHAGAAVSVRKALNEQAEASNQAAQNLAPKPELLDPTKPARPPGRARKPGPARPSVRGRPTTPDEAPLAHAPAANRPDEPPLRTTLARTHGDPAPHRATRRRTGNDATTRVTERPRPSRVLAELHAALADDAAAAE